MGTEVYHLNFCARQLGCPQLIPLKSCKSCNRATSWRDTDDLEISWYAASITALMVLFDGWGSWTVYAEMDAKNLMVQTIKDINTQVIEGNFQFCLNIGGQSVQIREVIVTSIIAAGDLELPSEDEEDEILAEQPAIEATPSARRKRKETALLKTVLPSLKPLVIESPPPPPTKAKRLRKRTEVEYMATEETAAAPTTNFGTDEELREAFKVEIPAEVIAESIALAQKQQESSGAELTSSELALFEDAKPEHTTAVPASEEQAEQSALEPMPIHSVPGSPATTSFADPELAEFEAMDLDAQLDKLEKLSSTPGKAKAKVVDEAMERVKIWQSTELDENMEAVDQTWLPSLGLARDVLNLHNRYEDLKPTFKTSELCKATHEANLADYAKQKAELNQMVAGYKEAKATTNRLEKQIEEL
ncbi:unnamed protein product [Prunus brigantina]